MNIFIYTHPYNENTGGVIALHRLCHIINETSSEHKAFLVGELWPHPFFKKIRYKLKNKNIFSLRKGWNTPIWTKRHFPKNAVVIYPEVVEGNPLKIKNVVRWFLHNPGFHTGKVGYGQNELYFKFNSAIQDFHLDQCKLSPSQLKVIYYPIDTYKNQNLERDIESCYMIRKGGSKPQVHSVDAICLDGKSHKEVAEIFNRAKQFISYDDYTAYSLFAVLAGCESIVVPSELVSLEEWYPNTADRYGLSYGFSQEQRDWAENTKSKVFEYILNEHKQVELNVQGCMKEIKEFFNISK